MVSVLPTKKSGRPLLLGEMIDKKVQAYIEKIRVEGGSVLTRVVVSAAQGILLASNKSMLTRFGGHIENRLDHCLPGWGM